MRAIILTFGLVVFSLPLRAQLEPFGLEGKRVTSLTIYQQTLFAATDSQGVYRRDLNNPAAGWISLGLTGLRLSSVFPYRIDSARFFLFVGVNPDRSAGDFTMVYRLSSETAQWIPSDSGMIRTHSGVSTMHGISEEGIIYAGGPTMYGMGVYKFESNHWKNVFESPPPFFLTVFRVYVDPQHHIVSAGGTTAFQTPCLARSTDGDRNWKRLPVGWWGYPTSVYSIAIDPDSPSSLYVGVGDKLLRTRDDGTNWETLFQQEAVFGPITINPLNVNHMFVGRDSANTFRLLETTDRGMSWSHFEPQPQRKAISSLVFDLQEGRMAYVGTKGDGVFRYRSLLMNVEERHEVPLTFHLGQNYPNPFNQMTTIDLYAEGNGESVPLEIYDLLGRKIRTLEDGKFTQGLYRFRWDGTDEQGKDVPSGVYLYRAQIGEQSTTRALLLLR